MLLGWHEVRAMGFPRALWRVGYELRKRLGLLGRPGGPDPDDPTAVLSEFTQPFSDEQALLDYLRSSWQGRFFFDLDRRAEYVAAVEDLGAAGPTVADADEICRRRFRLLGQDFDFSGGEIDWHYEPQSQQSWPRLPWARVDIRSDQRLGDVKFTWELNRHQFWPVLGVAYWLTGDEKYARQWADQFESWCRQNPPETGVNWASNLEHALRIVSWWTTASLLMHSPAMTGPLLRRLIGLLVCKARHIVADLAYSRVNMANNHLLGDATGLAVLGMALPELREAARWRELGLKILWDEALRQIHPDGSSIECSAGYHRFVLQFYLLVIALAERKGMGVPQAVRRRVERMAEFVEAAIRPDGTLPQFGDWDSGLACRLGQAPVQDFRPVLSTAAVLLRRGDFKRAAGRLDPETVWLLGPEAVDVFESLDESGPARPRRAFEGAGLFVDRTGGGAHLFVRSGPFTSHTHADLLSLCLHAGGRDLLVESGTYTYNGRWRWRTYFRTTRAHNAVTIDEQGQALAHRVFRWLFEPRSANHFFADDGPFVFDGRQDGFRRLGVMHRRIVIEVAEGAWLCLDVLEGTGTHAVGIHWHLAADLSAEEGPGPVVTARRGGQTVLTVAAAATQALTVTVARGDEQSPAGWYSPEYGRKVPACEVTYAGRTPMPFCAATVLCAGAPGLAPSVPVLAGGEVRVRLAPCQPAVPQPDGRTADTIDVAYRLRPRRECRRGRIVQVGRIVRSGGPAEPLRARCLGLPPQ